MIVFISFTLSEHFTLWKSPLPRDRVVCNKEVYPCLECKLWPLVLPPLYSPHLDSTWLSVATDMVPGNLSTASGATQGGIPDLTEHLLSVTYH